MRRLLLSLALVLSVGVATTPVAEAHHRKCGEINVTSRKSNARFIRCAATHAGVSPEKAVDVARCESGLWWKAWSESRRYGGSFQQDKYEWPDRVREYLNPKMARKTLNRKHNGILNAKANARVSVRMAVGGWGPWPICGD